MNIIDRFSTHLREVLIRSIRLATELKNTSVEPMHLFFAISLQKGSVANELLVKYKVDSKKIERAMLSYDESVPQDPTTNSPETDQISLSPFSLSSKMALEKAMLIAQENGHNYIGTEHLLSALLATQDEWLDKFFQHHSLKTEDLQSQLETVMNNVAGFPQINDVPEMIDKLQDSLSLGEEPLGLNNLSQLSKKGKKKESALDFFAANLTSPEIQTNIDPVIGRETEIERMIQIICRRTKNNPVLLGDPGVGKTAIVEGLAKKIVSGDVPDILRGKKIYALDMGLLIAGTTYRGEFEARLRQIIEDVANNPDIILFIDELHNIVGAGSNQGTLDASNILKPVLARGQLRCIGATTPAEFKKYIESDAALERRFQPIYIKESSVGDTIKILNGIKTNYENYHHLKITGEAIEAAAKLADKYMTNKFLPDKALDLLDETAAAKRLKTKQSPWETKLWNLKQKLEQTVSAKEEAATADHFEQAVKLKDKESKLKIEIAKLSGKKKTAGPFVSLTKEDIIKQLAKIIDAPVGALLSNERGRLNNLEENIKNFIVGQEEVINKTSKLIRQAQLQLSDPQRPLASFMFVGESGVGKTELAKTLAKILYPNQNSLVHLNMSEFNEGFSVSKLLGSPAGYVGYKESNQFTDKIKLNPYCVVLLDEIDKAHHDVAKLLLQMLENGEITDAVGKKISLKHAIIILTTSLGAEEARKAKIGFGQDSANLEQQNQKRIKEKLKEFFSPELINRLDQVCIFNNLNHNDLAKIAQLEISQLNERLKNYHTVIKTEPEIMEWLVKQLPEKHSSARDVRQEVRGKVEDLISEVILNGKMKSKYQLALEGERLIIK
ncbi:MAG: ATP-dependent Clp protease ATP-binding subunit [Patescibacteria group bacterium]